MGELKRNMGRWTGGLALLSKLKGLSLIPSTTKKKKKEKKERKRKFETV
jgi:hypothetical protein